MCFFFAYLPNRANVRFVAERTGIDKEAAERFIKHAIAETKKPRVQIEDPSSGAEAPSTGRVPVKITSKMRQREQYERELKALDEQETEDEVLEVFGDEPNDMDVDSSTTDKGKGKGKDTSSSSGRQVPQPNRKLRRPAIDPFSGW